MRLCELLLSIPLAALIVSVSWFGFMGDHFERIAAQDGHVAIGGLKAGAQGGARAKPMAAGFAGAEHPASAAQDASATQAGAGSEMGMSMIMTMAMTVTMPTQRQWAWQWKCQRQWRGQWRW